MIRLVMIDVDGTLVGPHGVPQSAWQAAERARQRGLRLSICTGRPGRGHALGYAQQLDASNLHIFESGAAILDAQGRPAHSWPLQREILEQVVQLARQHQLALEGYTVEGAYLVEQPGPDLEQHQLLMGIPFEVGSLLSSAHPLIRLQFVARSGPGWSQVRPWLLAQPQIELHEATSPGMPQVVFASVTARGVSKLAAAGWLAQQAGFSLAQVAMIGDGDNDLEAIRGVGLGIAMGNAPQHVRAAAAHTVAPVESDGLAQALDWIGAQS